MKVHGFVDDALREAQRANAVRALWNRNENRRAPARLAVARVVQMAIKGAYSGRPSPQSLRGSAQFQSSRRAGSTSGAEPVPSPRDRDPLASSSERSSSGGDEIRPESHPCPTAKGKRSGAHPAPTGFRHRSWRSRRGCTS